jgi:hypothetical protein
VSEAGAALKAGDQLVAELMKAPAPQDRAPTMGNLKKISYTHDAMIDLIIEHPEYTQNQLAARFGYTAGWVSNILAADAFQERMEQRKNEIVDPAIKATIAERFRALVIQSIGVLQQKLNSTTVSDNVAIRAAELGAKALGIGGNAPPPPAPATDRLLILAQRLQALNSPPPVQTERILNAEEVTVLNPNE